MGKVVGIQDREWLLLGGALPLPAAAIWVVFLFGVLIAGRVADIDDVWFVFEGHKSRIFDCFFKFVIFEAKIVNHLDHPKHILLLLRHLPLQLRYLSLLITDIILQIKIFAFVVSTPLSVEVFPLSHLLQNVENALVFEFLAVYLELCVLEVLFKYFNVGHKRFILLSEKKQLVSQILLFSIFPHIIIDDLLGHQYHFL